MSRDDAHFSSLKLWKVVFLSEREQFSCIVRFKKKKCTQ